MSRNKEHRGAAFSGAPNGAAALTWGPLVATSLGPYGPLWAHMGPIWVLLDRSGHDQIRTFGPISHVSGPEMVF